MKKTKEVQKRPYKRIELIVARVRKDKNQIEAAAELGISANYLRKLELGIDSPGRDTMICMSKYYDVSERVLFPDLFL